MRPKKHLGQHFLTSLSIIKKIAALANTSSCIFEIGPGKGVLTRELLTLTERLIAIEKDPDMIYYLSQKFKKELLEGKLTLINADILAVSYPTYTKNESYSIVGNIPYYITGAIIRHSFEQRILPQSVTLLVQKEVAQRVVAKDKKQSILSLSVKLFGSPEYKGTVSRKVFSPPPKVDSGILHINSVSRDRLDTYQINETDYFNVVKHAFSQKRKKALSNLTRFYPKEILEKVFHKHNLSFMVRAEDIPEALWPLLVRDIYSTL